ncbi:MAG: aminodeoxychorismate lyase [Pseudomonadota bacterium]|nr:aminodeoxychorismate lyase [Pseudomonadota bacterium]
MNTRCYIGSERVDRIDDMDRGLSYGDGLFETMLAHEGTLPWWDAHWSRLAEGARRLRMPLPTQSQVMAEALALLDGGGGVLKMIVTRGAGGRGYAPPVAATPSWILSRHPLPPPAPAAGLTLRWCEVRLALQPALAGIKHCNRLEQVLARAEWLDVAAPEDGADEGLMRSTDGDVVCATAANVFVLHGSQWRTPKVDRCGVDGICRQWLLGVLDVEQSRLDDDDLYTADAVVLCNAVRGILPVRRLGSHCWPAHEQVARLQRQLAAAHAGFSFPALPFS